MKLSTKTRYATRAMLELALKYDDGPVSAKEIAEHQEVSPKYLESLLAALRNGGLVHSVRGANGGHLLARSPDQVSIRDIFEVLEGTDGFVHCTTHPESCDRAEECVTQQVWAQMHGACMATLQEITLAELVRQARSKSSFGTYII